MSDTNSVGPRIWSSTASGHGGGGLGVSRYHGIVSSAYGVYRLIDAQKNNPQFIHELVRSTPFNWELLVRSKGIWTSRLQLTDEAFLEIPFPLPPSDEQAAIVRFLDHADRRIRRYIRAKRQLIALLNEQKQALIHRAVTRGLDPNVRLKPSGVEWLGDVPEHWEVLGVKHASRVLRGKFTHRPRNDPALYDGPYPFIQTGEVAKSEKVITAYRQTLNERGLHVSKLFPAGTLVMTIAANIPERHDAILEALEADEMVTRTDGGLWSITNLGAVLFAKKLADFRSLRRKVVRVIVYGGSDRIETVREQEGIKGYAAGFEGLIRYVNALLPSNEVIGSAIRKTVPLYPELAVRELIANALIHQDFFVTGSGPMVEIFNDRMEITNPGAPLVNTERFLDSPPRSRNELLASFMRRIGVCEERGSGVDKVVFQTEYYQLPPPVFEQAEENTRVVLFAPQPLTKMDQADRTRACYLHACLKYVNRDFLTNASIRERFRIEPENKAMASRYIREAVEAGRIRAYDGESAPKLRKYVPFWA